MTCLVDGNCLLSAADEVAYFLGEFVVWLLLLLFLEVEEALLLGWAFELLDWLELLMDVWVELEQLVIPTTGIKQMELIPNAIPIIFFHFFIS